MKTRIFLMAACLTLFASLSFGQGFNAQIYNDDHALLQNCDGAPLPDGTQLYIYWDANSNGPDAADAQPVVGPNVGNVNYNTFPLNGEADLSYPGGFVTGDDFSSVGINPQPNRYYVTTHCGDGSAQWVSEVFLLNSGPNTIDLNAWGCNSCAAGCTPTPEATIQVSCGPNDPSCRTSVCLDLCNGYQTVVRVCGPASLPLDPDHAPVATVTPGCVPPDCDRQCTPAGNYGVQGPIPDPATHCWIYIITGGQPEGCACFTFQGFLAAGIESFSGVAGDNEIMLSWVTSSEVNVLSYAVVRNNEVIGHVTSENSPTSHTYSYTDETAVNGTTYTYTLRVVNGDETVTETGLTWEGTPSFSNAIVTEYALLQNFPNPFNPTTQIAFDVLNTNPVTLKIYNAAGQEVATLLNGVSKDNGRHVVNFDSGNLTSGLYFYTVKIGNEFSATKKMLLVK
jgi:hypothetical protein